MYIDQIRQISSKKNYSDVYAVVLQEGLANICIIRNGMCIVRSRIEKVIPGKGRGGASQSEKAMQGFFSAISDTLLGMVDFDKVKVILLCSSGYLNSNLLEYILTHGDQVGVSTQRFKSKFLCIHSNSGHVYSLRVCWDGMMIGEEILSHI